MLATLHAMTRGFLPWLLRGTLTACALGLPAAHAENGCGAMASLQNPNAMHGGIGGTGAPALSDKPSSQPLAGRPGIGGTGAAEGGIGGTGIVGVITGFASICVNGLEVHYDTSTTVSADGRPTSLSDLAVGQVVAVQAVGVGDELSARSIAVMHAAVGPIGRVDSQAGQLQVLGQAVRVADKAMLAGLKPGNWVQVSGYRLVSGELVASRVESIAPQAQAQVTGQMGAVSDNGFGLHGARVKVDNMRLSDDAVPGTEVSVRGRWDGTTLHAHAVTVAPSRQNVGRAERVVLEGYVHAVFGDEVSLGNRVVTLAPGVKISGVSGDRLAVNQRVQISGRVGKDQRVTVDRVNVRSRSTDAKTDPRRATDDDSDRDNKRGDDRDGDDSSGKSDDSDSSDSKSGSSGSDDSGKSDSDSDDSSKSESTSSLSSSSDRKTSGSSDGDSSDSGSSSGDSSGSSGSSSGTSGKGSSGSSSGSSGGDSSGSGGSGSGSSGKGSSGSSSGSSGSSGNGSSGGGGGSSGKGSSGGGKSGGGKR